MSRLPCRATPIRRRLSTSTCRRRSRSIAPVLPLSSASGGKSSPKYRVLGDGTAACAQMTKCYVHLCSRVSGPSCVGGPSRPVVHHERTRRPVRRSRSVRLLGTLFDYGSAAWHGPNRSSTPAFVHRQSDRQVHEQFIPWRGVAEFRHSFGITAMGAVADTKHRATDLVG